MALFDAACAAQPRPRSAGTVISRHRSPDRAWYVSFSRLHGYGRLDFTEARSGRTSRLYRSNDSCCEEIRWVKPHLLVFVDDYRTFTLNSATRKLIQLASFSNYVISTDGKWLAGWADSGGHEPETVDVVGIHGGKCRKVPPSPYRDDNALRFSSDDRTLIILPRVFNRAAGEALVHGRPTGVHQVAVPMSKLQPVARC